MYRVSSDAYSMGVKFKYIVKVVVLRKKTAVFLPTRALDKGTEDHKIFRESRDVYSSRVRGKCVIKVVLAAGILSTGRGKYNSLFFLVPQKILRYAPPETQSR